MIVDLPRFVRAEKPYWEELDQHPALDTLLTLPRPSLASDAFARLAMSKLPDPPDLVAFEPVATLFNALIDSVSAIRSGAGARYYTLWALAGGEPPAVRAGAPDRQRLHPRRVRLRAEDVAGGGR